DATGMQHALGNTGSGIKLTLLTVGGTMIGGTGAGEGNVISANQWGINSSQASNTTVQGNLIGTDATGLSPLGNQNEGILLQTVSDNNTIGGTAAGAGNTIAFTSSGPGVKLLAGSTGDAIQGNAIHSNRDGIFLDPNSSDNNLQSAPVLTSALHSGSNLVIQG